MTRPDFTEPGEVLEFLDGIRERNRQAMARNAEYAAEAGGITGEGFSADRTVRAEVDASGVVSRVDIGDSALRRGAHLAQMILTAIREAQAARTRQLAELSARLGSPAIAGLVRESIPDDYRRESDG
ncbi:MULTISPECIES: YbaB/EbfC family nucleoid-associated protein [Actinoplanes]|uniref:YbaB/EbfC DNA-binding family protein n=2 Tax=Actinoplanes TaxID=1865 RepID=A0A0X3V747_9ACTN|nr:MULTISPECIES: YbaB/EbfC family nucleoid-associated protein [Actinoplanes]KUL40560.1 hypothetical protein ADL15_06095 [Actinoplanes awajinensis subsp. mycoplanecinus]GIE71043.1 hypothetical protein Apa02nite_071510 [Actinoplanes palleronii]